MLDFNGIGIKSPEDLQEALNIETNSQSFKIQFLNMVNRWGLEDATSMLATALCGNKDDIFPLSPLIKFTKRMVAEGPSFDPWESYRIEKIL